MLLKKFTVVIVRFLFAFNIVGLLIYIEVGGYYSFFDETMIFNFEETREIMLAILLFLEMKNLG